MLSKEMQEIMNTLIEREIERRDFSKLDAEFYAACFAEGFKQGYEQVIEKGREDVRRSVALSMLRDDLSFKFISKYCGYPEQKIKELRDNFVKKGLLPA